MSTESPEAPPNRGRSLTALSIADAARLLSAVGGQAVTQDMITADLAAGAPANADGTINLVAYAAWLVKQQAVRPLGCSAVGEEDRPGFDPNSLTVQ